MTNRHFIRRKNLPAGTRIKFGGLVYRYCYTYMTGCTNPKGNQHTFANPYGRRVHFTDREFATCKNVIRFICPTSNYNAGEASDA